MKQAQRMKPGMTEPENSASLAALGCSRPPFRNLDIVIPTFSRILPRFSSSSPAPARFKEMLQCLRESFPRVEAQSINAGALECAIQFGQAFGVGIGKLL